MKQWHINIRRRSISRWVLSLLRQNGASVQKEPSRGVLNFVYCKSPVISYILYKNHVWKKLQGNTSSEKLQHGLCMFYKIEPLYRFLFSISNNLRTSTLKNPSGWLLLMSQCNIFMLNHKFAAGRKRSTIFFYGCSFVAKLSWKKNIFFLKNVFYKIYSIYLYKKCFYMERKFYVEKFLYRKNFFTEKNIIENVKKYISHLRNMFLCRKCLLQEKEIFLKYIFILQKKIWS